MMVGCNGIVCIHTTRTDSLCEAVPCICMAPDLLSKMCYVTAEEEEPPEELPVPQLAIFAEVLTISRATLRRTGKRMPPEANFCPMSVANFAWPVLEFITTDR